MDTEKVEQAAKKVIGRDDYGNEDGPKFHPSQVTGCPLKVHLNKMTRNDTVLNSWMFQGSAVHYYLQESGMMDEIMLEAGYDMFETDYEVSNMTHIGDGVYITGTCDIITHGDDGRTIFDIKYSSIPVESGHGRLYKYFSQANTYAWMFDADHYGLIVINSKSQDLVDSISVLSGEPNEENWELTKAKTKAVHEALAEMGYYDSVVWAVDDLEEEGTSFWEDVMSHFDKGNVPSYDKECQYCDHSDYCPVKQGKLSSGLSSFRGGG